MTDDRNRNGGRGGISWRMIGWSVPALLLLIPLVGNWPWTLSDFVFMGVLFGLVGLLIELAVRASGNVFYRAGAGVAVVAAFLLIWVNGAVGFLGSEDNPANLLFFGVIGVAIVGSAFAGFKPAGMGQAMFAAAAAQVLVGVVALAAGLGSPGGQGLYEVVMGTSVFAGMWLVAGGLFRNAVGGPAGGVAAR